MFAVKNINLSMNVLLDEVNFGEFCGDNHSVLILNISLKFTTWVGVSNFKGNQFPYFWLKRQ